MKIRIKFLTVLLPAVMLCLPLIAFGAPRTVRVGFFHFAGYHEIGKDGEKSGYGYEYLQNLRKYTGWKFEYVGYGKSWAEMLNMLERGEIDFVSSAVRTPERERKFAFTESPLGNSAVIMTVKANDDRYHPGDYRNWNGIRVGLLRGSSKNEVFIEFARKKGFHFVPVWFDSAVRMNEDLLDGRGVDALVTGSLRRLRNEWVYEQLNVRPFYIIVRKDNTVLLNELNTAMRRLRLGSPGLPDRLRDKYYSGAFQNDVLFSVSERTCIREMNTAGRVLRVLVNPDRPPFSSFRDGRLHGVLQEVANEFSKRSGLRFEFVETPDRDEYRRVAAGDKVDLIFDLPHDYGKAEKLDCALTEPYFFPVVSRIRRRNFFGKPDSVALVRNSNIADSNLKYGLDGMVPTYYDSNRDVIAAVRQGRQDCGMVYTRTAEKAIADDEFGTLEAGVVGGLFTPFAVGVKLHCDPRLISILDKTVRSLGKKEMDRIVMRHVVFSRRASSLAGVLMDDPALSFSVLGGVLLLLLLFFVSFWILKRNLWRYGKIVSKLPLRFFVIDANEHILTCSLGNENTLDKAGCLSWISNLPETVYEMVRGKVREVLKTGQSCTVDFELHGRRRTAEAVRLPDKTFRNPAILWISMDTTELQKTREEALLNAERFRLTLQAIGDGVMVTDENGRITMLNDVAEGLTGWKNSAAQGVPHETVFNIHNYLDDTPMQSPVRTALKYGKNVMLANHAELISRDGGRYHIADSAAPIRDGAGKTIGSILVFRDISEEYAARRQLREALTSLEYASELAIAAAFHFDPVTRKLTGSKILSGLWGVDENGIAVPIRKWVCREDRRTMLEACAELAEGKVNVMTVEYRSECSGSIRHYRMKASADRSNPRAVRFVGVIQDVTEIVRSAGRLKSQQELWEKVINAIPVMFFAKDAEDSFRYVLCNRSFAAFNGKTPEEVIGRTDGELFSRPENVKVFLEKDREIMTKAEGECFEEDVVDCNGLSRHIRTVKQAFVGPDGRKMLLGTSSDITELSRLIISERINSEILAQALVEVDFDRELENLAGTLQKYTNCSRIILAECNAKGKLRIYREWCSEGVLSLRDFDTEKHNQTWDEHLHDIMLKNEALVIPDISKNEITAGLKLDERYQTNSLIVVPIFVENKLWGTLFASCSSRMLGFSENDEGLMRSCANVVALMEIRNRQKQAVERAFFEKQMIFNNIRIPLWLHDGNGKLLQVNNAVNKLAGVSPGELTTERNREIFCSGMTNRPIVEVLKTSRTVRQEVRFRNGEYIVNAEPVFDESGTLIYIVKSAVDITDLNALLENQKVVNFCLETLLGGDDMDHAIVLAQEAICRHLGASRSYMIRFNPEKRTMDCFVEYLAPGSEPIFSGIKDQPYSSIPPWEERFRQNPDIIIEDMQNADSTEVGSLWIDTIRRHNIQSFFGKRLMLDSKVWGYLGLVFDQNPRHFSEQDKQFCGAVAHFVELMLERRRTRKQLLDTLKDAQAASKAKSYFLATMSHEIRTPLNAVIGFSELLKSGGLSPEEQAEYLDSINLAGNSLLQLINDVLDLSKLEAEQTVLTPCPTDLTALFREVQAIFQYKAQEKGLSFQLKFRENPPVLKLDNLRLRQILLNLIGNAVKFTGQGGVTLSVEFQRTGVDRGTLVICVQDTGIGITKEAQQKIFEPFVQGNAIRDTHVYKGTGLGLAISRRLVERMNGVIFLESESGKGSRFIIRLENVELAEPEFDSAAEPEAPVLVSNAGDFPVLVVDDVPMNLRVLAAMLRKLNAVPVTAESGEKALACLERRKAGLVLTDMWMPGMDGAKLAEKIHSLPGCETLPVVAVTADTESRENFSLNHFSDILLKPVTLEKLKRILEKYRT